MYQENISQKANVIKCFHMRQMLLEGKIGISNNSLFPLETLLSSTPLSLLKPAEVVSNLQISNFCF